MNKKIAIIGVVILVFGFILTGVGYTGIMNESMRDLADDYNQNQFESYDEGDTVTVTGEITDEEGGSFYGLQGYRYEIDDVDQPGFLVGNDIGDEGDRITVTLKVNEYNGVEVLEAQTYSNPTWRAPISLLGLVLLIIGVIIAIVGFVKSGKEELGEERPIQKQAQPQKPAPPESEESMEDSSGEEF